MIICATSFFVYVRKGTPLETGKKGVFFLFVKLQKLFANMFVKLLTFTNNGGII